MTYSCCAAGETEPYLVCAGNPGEAAKRYAERLFQNEQRDCRDKAVAVTALDAMNLPTGITMQFLVTATLVMEAVGVRRAD
jgi:hypothetical protein